MRIRERQHTIRMRLFLANGQDSLTVQRFEAESETGHSRQPRADICSGKDHPDSFLTARAPDYQYRCGGDGMEHPFPAVEVLFSRESPDGIYRFLPDWRSRSDARDVG